jgi:alkylation response protein AidB-like acyl-CoA dehydrogenase
MNFELSEDQQMLADSVRQFARKESPLTRLRAMRKNELGWEKPMWKRLGEQGWLGILYPETLGGFGGTFVDMMLVLEQTGATLMSEPVLASAVLGGLPILFAGSEAQQKRLLQPMIAGDTSLAFAFAEEESRFDIEATALAATANGERWTLNGAKRWVPNGQGADVIVVVARTAGKAGDRDGLALFAVPANTPGLTVQTVNGMDSHKYANLTFKGVTVDGAALLGAAGQAYATVERVLDYGAAAAAAEGVGIAQEMLQTTVGYLNTRKQFGVFIGSFQALQHKAVDMFVETELVRSMAIEAAIKVDSADAQERKAAVSAAKAQLSIGGKFVSQNALQLHGGIGVTDEADIGLYFKRMHHLNILCGDEMWHAARYAGLPGFTVAARA